MDFDDLHPKDCCLIGNYILERRIGSGSFAVVWKSRHRHLGTVFAVKEIHKKKLLPKVSDSLLREISILRTVNHPNIIHLFEAIQTDDSIYLILEYCAGGDLWDYINRHGKVSEAVARDLMRQLASGLKVLQEKHLIHRDLKPQNLLLSSKEGIPLLKIGDFGFARSLANQALADTLCGSPLYMAPEIMNNQKYDAKADLWSVGAILFQLLTGKLPFTGSHPAQLFKNITESTELKFPKGALEELHPDSVNLCRSLLRQNPGICCCDAVCKCARVLGQLTGGGGFMFSPYSFRTFWRFCTIERLSFKEFFNHKFFQEPRSNKAVETTPVVQSLESASSEAEKVESHLEQPIESSNRDSETSSSTVCNRTSRGKNIGSSVREQLIEPSNKDAEITSSSVPSSKSKGKNICSLVREQPIEPILNRGVDELKSLDCIQQSLNQIGVSDSMDSIEKDYVLVNAHCPSMETSSYHLETSLQGSLRVSHAFIIDQDTIAKTQKKELIASTRDIGESSRSRDQFSMARAASMLREVQGLSILHPSTRLQLFNQYLHVLSDLSQEKCNAGMFLESFSVELVALALWKEAVEISGAWLSSSDERKSSESSLGIDSTTLQKDADDAANEEGNVDFNRPSSVSKWAQLGFIAAVDRTEKLSQNIQEIDGATVIPDAMEIIFQKAISLGKSGAVDQYMENKDNAAASYSKAILLFSFILGEAESLNSPFSLTSCNKQRIQHYIHYLQTQTNLLSP
ncbi:serine/threonine-protein kinase ATG1a isoform X2 [Cucumis melo]|uniref:Serine/threonine-protein kinase ATG1a isoform X2 n=1 Tax=Cucumis melo TaxID=3656 RepID=A0A1S3CB51_CUCME|nr:serine/threonine-protein kinase ATG1a isoform X2 [Cucumis melo]